MSKHLVALRLARREVLRRPGRTLLVMLLVAIPIAGMTASSVILRTSEQTPAEEWSGDYGDADAVASYSGDTARGAAQSLAEQRASIEANVPEGSRLVEEIRSYARLRGDDGRVYGGVVSLDPTDPIYDGRYELKSGVRPTTGFEIAVPADLADRLGVRIGDTIDVGTLTQPFEMVGVLEDRSCFRCDEVYVAPPGATAAPFGPANQHVTLIQLSGPLTDAQLAALTSEVSGAFETRDARIASQTASGGTNGIAWTIVIGAVCLAVVGIVIAAAFAVGARRQLQTIGQLGANGATTMTQRATLALQGTVSGLLGSVVGFVIAAVGLAVAQGWLERSVLDRRLDDYVVNPVDLAVVAAVGMTAATVAALVPAWTVTRVPILSAIAGRRPLGRVRRSVTLAGLLAMAIGLGLLGIATIGSGSGQDGDLWALVAIAGGLGVLFGSCALTPQIVAQLEPVAARTSGVIRLAARSLTRQRTRSGAVIAAIAAAGALAIGGVSLVRSAELGAYDEDTVPSDVVVVATFFGPTGSGEPPPATLSQIAGVLPEARRIDTMVAAEPFRVTSPTASAEDGTLCCLTTSGRQVVGGNDLDVDAMVVGDEFADAFDLPDRAREMLATSGVVVLIGNGAGAVSLDVTPPGGEPIATSTVESDLRLAGNSVLISDELVAELGLEVVGGPVVFENPRPLNESERTDLQDVLYPVPFDGSPTAPVDEAAATYIDVQYPSSGLSPFAVELALSGLAVAFALLVVTIGLALSASETRDERDVLTVVGAPPRALARVSGSKAWLLGLVGFALAVPVGMLPVLVFQSADDHSRPVAFPGSIVAFLVVVVPIVVGVVAWFGSAVAQRIRRVTISRLAFE